MSPNHTRRRFLATTACSGACLLASTVSSQAEDGSAPKQPTKPPDFDALSYCCVECTPEQCPLLKASLVDDVAFKKQVAARWQAKFGRSFSPEEVFCFGCKAAPARQSYAVGRCTVKACVLGKKLVSCAHCRELATCQKELWINYPGHREMVLAIQKTILG